MDAKGVRLDIYMDDGKTVYDFGNDYTEKGREEGRKEESERYNKQISFLVRDKKFDAFERISRDGQPTRSLNGRA